MPRSDHKRALLACKYMASKLWGRHGGGVQLLTSVLLALSTPQAIHCGTSAGSTAHHDRLTTPPTEDITPPAESGRSLAEQPALSAAAVAFPPSEPARGNAPLEVQMLDFSFSPLGPRGLQDTDIDAAAGGLVEEGQQQQQHPDTDPPPSALSLRECSLGDLGVAEVARSPWVRGKAGVRALSLRQNQVRSFASSRHKHVMRSNQCGMYAILSKQAWIDANRLNTDSAHSNSGME